MISNDAAVPREEARLLRLGRAASDTILRFSIDGEAVDAMAGDSLLVAILTSRPYLRRHEFDGGVRAGFCAMGACQDCWVWTETGERLQACLAPVTEGLRIRTTPPAVWPGDARP